MFSIFNKNKEGVELKLKINGMHCVSCAMSIDGTLEDMEGVIKSKTNYAKGETTVVIDPKISSEKKITEAIGELGYNIIP